MSENIKDIKELQWLLEQKNPSLKKSVKYNPGYGDVTKFNSEGIIIKNVDRKTLETLSDDIMDLLDTSFAIYERNGDYAFGRFDSSWCQLMDSSSFKLCNTDDTKKALTCGDWLCHEDCWNNSAKEAMNTRKSTDIECVGGIHLYAEPIKADDEIIGCINIGYGNPPKDEKVLTELAKKYNIDKNEITKRAKEYKPRPPFIIENAKKRLKNIAMLIGQIVENSNAKKKLQESEELLNATGSMAKVGGWELNLKTNEVEWTKATREIHEVPEDYIPTLEEAIHFFPGEAKEKMEKAVQNAIEKGISYDMIIPFVTAKGKNLWTRTIGKPVLKNGKCIRLYGTFQDITKQKNIEEQLKTNSEKFENLYNSIRDSILVTNKNREIIDCNKAFSDLFGYREEEIKGKQTSYLYKDLKEFEEMGQKIKENMNVPNFILTISYKKKSGAIFPGETNVFYLKNKEGEIIGFIGLIRDVTEKKKAERKLQELNEELAAQNEEYESITEELQQTVNDLEIAKENIQESEERFEALHNASFGGIAIHDKGVILECNQGLSKLTGYNYDELIGMDGLLLIAEETRDEVMNKILSEYEEPYEAIGQRKNGEKYPVRLEARMIPYKGKKVRVVEFRDITIQKKHELTIKQINEELTTQNEEYENLNEELRQTVEELQKAKERAEESDRLKSAFLANMSHEIRTPMNGILGFTDLLKKPGLSGEKKEKYVDVIQKSGKRMLNTINDIVEISKIEAGDIKPELTQVNINEQLDYYYTFFKPEVDSKGMQLSVKKTLKNNQVNILTDSSMFNSILTNLIKNAIKYSDKGNIEFGYVLTKKQNELTFYVKDTGIGIPKEKFDDIFNRFVQADIGDTRAAQGSGLGLAITKAYVEILGGKIWLESKENEGSTFYFTLPFTHSENSSKSINDQNQKKRTESIKDLKILIVEDDRTSDMHLSILLQENAKEILHTTSGKEAIEICRTNPDINLILMDIRLPGLNGYEATKQIRKFNKDVVIIAQTAYALKGDREKAIEAGCNEYITKPIEENQLLELIENKFKPGKTK